MSLFHKKSGFSLVQLSAVILAAGLVAAAVIPAGDGSDGPDRYTKTLERLKTIDKAFENNMIAQGRRPCPASGEYYPGHAKFGLEDGTAGDCSDSGATDGLLTPFNDTNIIAGTVPVTALGLDESYYFDGWGRPFTYVVDKRTTSGETCVALTSTGDIKFYDSDGGTLLNQSSYALISHGKDGHGAFQSAGSTRANRLDAGSTNADQINNAGVSGFTGFDIGGSNPTAFVNEWVSREVDFAGGYDDVVWYSPKRHNSCCVGKSCGVNLASLAGGGEEAAATPTFRDISTTTHTSWATTWTGINPPASVVTGDIMIMYAGVDTSAVVATPPGWTSLGSQQGSNAYSPNIVKGFAFYKVADASDEAGSSSYSLGFTNIARGSTRIVAYSGVDTADPFDVNSWENIGHNTENVNFNVAGTTTTENNIRYIILTTVNWDGDNGTYHPTGYPAGYDVRGPSVITITGDTAIVDKEAATAGAQAGVTFVTESLDGGYVDALVALTIGLRGGS